MIINLNITNKNNVDQMADRAAEITEDLLNDITNMAEMNVLTLLGANLLSNGVVNKAMQEGNGDVTEARHRLNHVLDNYRNSLQEICLNHLANIESGAIPKVELRK